MGNLDEFTMAIAGISHSYKIDDIGYSQAEFLVGEEVDKLLSGYPLDVPDRIMETAFEAFADLQIQAYHQQDVTESEAINAISQRAEDLFDKSRSPKDIMALCKPYEAHLHGDDAESAENFTHSDNDGSDGMHSTNRIQGYVDEDEDKDPPGFFGGFSLN